MSGMLQMLFGLAVVLAAIGGAAWLARRAGIGSLGASGLLKPVGALPVGPKERVVVVEIQGRWLVLGVAAGRVSALAEMPRGELPQAPTIAPFDFKNLLKKHVAR